MATKIDQVEEIHWANMQNAGSSTKSNPLWLLLIFQLSLRV